MSETTPTKPPAAVDPEPGKPAAAAPKQARTEPPQLLCRVLANRTIIAGAFRAAGARLRVDPDTAKALAEAGKVEILGA